MIDGRNTALPPSAVRVVVVDDSQIIRERLTARLGQVAGACVVGVATDAREGMALISREHPDVVITDLRMPEGGGVRLLEGIRELDCRPTVVVLTNYPYASHRKRCLELGVEHFYDKSTEFERIDDVVRALRRRRRSDGTGDRQAAWASDP